MVQHCLKLHISRPQLAAADCHSTVQIAPAAVRDKASDNTISMPDFSTRSISRGAEEGNTVIMPDFSEASIINCAGQGIERCS